MLQEDKKKIYIYISSGRCNKLFKYLFLGTAPCVNEKKSSVMQHQLSIYKTLATWIIFFRIGYKTMSKATSNGVPPGSVLHTYMINTSISHLEVKIKSLLIQFAVDIHIGRRHNEDDESRFQSWVQIKWLCDKAARHKAVHHPVPPRHPQYPLGTPQYSSNTPQTPSVPPQTPPVPPRPP